MTNPRTFRDQTHLPRVSFGPSRAAGPTPASDELGTSERAEQPVDTGSVEVA